MDYTCEACGARVLDIDVKCGECGRLLASTGAHRMLGRVVLEQYEITDILGQGGMSLVYKARHKLTEQEVALKILPPEMAAHAQVKSRFLEEGRALAQLDHPHIVHLYNFGQENGCLVLAMQYIHGRTFERMILEAEAGALDWTMTAQVAIDVLKALEFAHGRGVIHRDMKPSNILVREDDGAATVMDFGIAKMTNSTKLTATGQTMGTVRYMSPEQVRGQALDARTDLYSLGATMYEAVRGDTPFDGETHFEIMSKHLHAKPRPPSLDGVALPAGFEAALMRALSKRPEDRFRDAAEFRAALEALLGRAELERAETQRMSRAALAIAARSDRPPTARLERQSPDGTPRGQAGRPSPLPDSVVTRPIATRPEVSEAAGPIAPVVDEPTAGLPYTAQGHGRRTGMWIGLTGVAVAAAAVGALVVVRARGVSQASSPPPAATAPPAARQLPVRWPAAFAPPDVTFEVEREYPADELRVKAPRSWDPDRIRDLVHKAHDAVSAVAAAEGMGGGKAIERQPLSVLVVPQLVFCDRRIYDPPPTAEPRDCNVEYVYFRPYEKTLFVLNDEGQVDDAILDGVATSVCSHQAICVSLSELHAWADAHGDDK